MAEQKQGGLGKGLAALIPSGPDAPTRKPRLGDSAADIILGNSTGSSERKARGEKRVKGAPTIQQGSGSKSSKKRQATPAAIGATYREISVGEIVPNPKQPRTVFDEDELSELVHSIREFGLLQPVVVRPSEEGGFEPPPRLAWPPSQPSCATPKMTTCCAMPCWKTSTASNSTLWKRHTLISSSWKSSE